MAEIPLVMFSLLCAYVTHSVLLGCFCLGAVARPSMPGRLPQAFSLSLSQPQFGKKEGGGGDMEWSQRVGKAVAGV